MALVMFSGFGRHVHGPGGGAAGCHGGWDIDDQNQAAR
jgi:hypothetical protein